ncbi:MAG: alpha-L-arabinofuranosidase, partial [Acidobacteriota bacterium]|nr:alpha-L-arabinofuranosidase [Acidobacteriota bacterium]
RHNGTHGVAVRHAPAGLDIAASRSGNRVWLHVVNLRYRGAVEAGFAVDGMRVAGGRVFAIAPENLRAYVNQDQPDVFRPQETELPRGADVKWRFPAGSVSAVELAVEG